MDIIKIAWQVEWFVPPPPSSDQFIMYVTRIKQVNVLYVQPSEQSRNYCGHVPGYQEGHKALSCPILTGLGMNV